MIIKYLTTEILEKQRNRRQLLIGKAWTARDPYNFMTGLVGVKKKGADWDFSQVLLHPGDRFYIKLNRWKTRLRDPEFLLYVENQPYGPKLAEIKKKPA